MGDVGSFGGYVIRPTRVRPDEEPATDAALRQDHFVAFAQGIRVPPALMDGLKADLARLNVELRAGPLTCAIRARALTDASPLVAPL